MYGNDREQLRKVYLDSWRKHQDGLPLTPMEHRVAEVIAEHPEYHQQLDPDRIDRDYPPESGAANPFLHMGMHIALREQIASARPAGIIELHRAILRGAASAHDAEHRMMDCLAEALWQAQRTGTAPDEAVYLDCLRKRG
ncbi:MAG: DUF1841 family protein [Gammaproteobacteria bacterium]|nr:DUF1841 family protein [Gammaproteobacteria bacterium]